MNRKGIQMEQLTETLRMEQDKKMDKLHSKELKNIGKNMTDSEQTDICYVINTKILQAELERRERIAVSLLKEITDCIATKYDASMSLTDMEQLITEIRDIVRG